MDTIVALSSGRPPAAIAVLRISGSEALRAVEALARSLPPPRQARVRALRDADGALLDRALVLVFPGPDSATGEDLVELHCHGGRAVVAAVQQELLRHARLREAEPGEFTRRALRHGRLDLAQAEGLADLLEAETETQRRAALMASEGNISRAIRGWLDRLALMAARVEASIDFAEEGDVEREDNMLRAVVADAGALRGDILQVLAAPPVERLRDGIRVVIGGPPNSGKSTLLNMLVGRDAAIVSPHSGTTRDRVEVPVQRNGIAWLLTDTAGLTEAADPVERIGVARAEEAIAAADLLLWLGDRPPPRGDALWVHARADLPGRAVMPLACTLATRQDRPESIELVWKMLMQRASAMLPQLDQLPLKLAQRSACDVAADSLMLDDNPLVAAEQLRLALKALGSVIGVNATEAMLDALFGRFCLGK